MIKLLKYIVVGWLVLSVVTAPFYWPFVRMLWVFVPNIAAANYDPPSTQDEARAQDVDYLAQLTKYDRSFNEFEKAEFEAALERIRAEIGTLSDAEFYLALAKAVALADNGHTNISYYPQHTQFNSIGARLYRFADGHYVVSATPDNADLVGRRVLEVEGMPVDEVVTALRPYRGGNTTWRDLYSTLIIESPELLAAAGIANSPDAVELTLETQTGEPETVSLAGRRLEDPSAAPWRAAWYSLVPERATSAFGEWRHVMDDPSASMMRYLTDPDNEMSYALDGNGLYIRALPGFAVGERPIKKVYKEILADHSAGSLDYLVVDFRLHDGGDYTKSISFAKNAPKAVKDDGTVYIITGPNTFSAAIVTAAMLKYYAGNRAIIIGEQMGDREQFWAERGSRFRLPNSEYSINYATGYHDWEKGCKGEPFCFTMNEMHEVPAGSLAPAVDIPQDFARYRQGEDVVMDWISEQR